MTGPVRLRVYWGRVWSTLYLRRELLWRLGISISSMTPNHDQSVDIVIETEAGLDVVAGLRSVPGVAGAVRIPLADGEDMPPTACSSTNGEWPPFRLRQIRLPTST